LIVRYEPFTPQVAELLRELLSHCHPITVMEDTGTLCRMCAEDEKRRRRDYERRRRERRGFVGPGERTDILW
jgi:hypothetical protein